MNHGELVKDIAARTEMAATDVSSVLSALADVVGENLSKGEKVTVSGLFIAERGERAARTGRNPQTGESMEIPAGHTVKFKVAAPLKRTVTEA